MDPAVKPAPARRTWRLRRPRGDGGRPLTAAERVIWPDADLYALIRAMIAQAVEDLDAGYGRVGSANERYWRAQAYLYFFHGSPTLFDAFLMRMGLAGSVGRLPEHPMFDDAAELERRRADATGLGLPPDLFDQRIAQLRNGG